VVTYAGDDPVNGSDPTGLHDCGWTDPGGCLGNAADSTGHFFSDPSRWRAEASFWAGTGNFIVSTAQSSAEASFALTAGIAAPAVLALENEYIPKLGISNPYCENSSLYTAGEWFGAGELAIATVGAGFAAGAAEEGSGAGLTRVGRWMSQSEYSDVTNTGTVQPGPNSFGTTYVANPADPSAYPGGNPGDIYAEFDVPDSSLQAAGKEGWAQIPGPNSLYSRLAARQGLPLPEFPPALNVEWVASRINPWVR